MIKNFFIIIFIFTCALLSYSEEPTLEESYIFIRVNEKFGDPFFRVYFKKNGKEVYVPLREFLNFSEITTLEIDETKKNISGSILVKNDLKGIQEKEFLTSYKEEKYFLKDGDVFVEIKSLKDVLNLKDLYWDESRSYLAVQLNYLLPFEVREIQEELKNNLPSSEDTKEKTITPERKLLTPGVLRLEYFLSDFDDRDGEQLDLLYNTQLLYGDFQLQTQLLPDQDLNQISLKYRDVIEDKLVVLGDSTLEKNIDLNVSENNIRGLSIIGSDVYTEIYSSTINIRGQVANGTTVELYQNQILIDLQVVATSNEYNFEGINLFYNDDFTLKFYYPNGRMEVKELSIYDDFELQSKGKSDYRLQLGESASSLAASAKYLYGLTDNITVGVGYLKAEHDEINEDNLTTSDFDPDGEYNIAEGSLIIRSRASRNPALLTLDWLHDIDDGSDATFRSNIKKQLWFLNTEFYYYGYSDEVSLVRRENKRYGALFGSNFTNFSYTLEYEMRETLSQDEDSYTLKTRYYLNKNTRMGFDTTYTKPENTDEEYDLQLSLDYSGFKNFHLNLLVDNTYSDGEWGDEEYTIGISKKSRYFGKGDLDYSLEASYSEDEWRFTAYLTYYLQDWLSFPARFTEDDQEVGVAVEKTFILSRLFKENGNPEPQDAWVEGKVFKDENNNGKMDPDETPIEGIEISSDGRTAKSKRDGSYYIDGIQGNNPVDIAPTAESLDPLLRFSKEKYSLKAIPATGHTLDIPLVPIISIVGEVAFKVEDISQAIKNKNLQYVKIYVKDGDKIISSNTAEYDGFFIVEGIVPGDYTVEAKYLGQRNYEIKQQTYELKVENGETGEFYEGFYFELIKANNKKESLKPDKIVKTSN